MVDLNDKYGEVENTWYFLVEGKLENLMSVVSDRTMLLISQLELLTKYTKPPDLICMHQDDDIEYIKKPRSYKHEIQLFCVKTHWEHPVWHYKHVLVIGSKTFWKFPVHERH